MRRLFFGSVVDGASRVTGPGSMPEISSRTAFVGNIKSPPSQSTFLAGGIVESQDIPTLRRGADMPFVAELFSSKKLLELALTTSTIQQDAPREAAIAELAKRGHYLTELLDRSLI